MSVQVAAIVARLEADIRDFDQKMGRADKRLKTLEGSSKRTAGALGGMAKAAIALGAVMVAGKLAQGVKAAISAASDYEESINAVEVATGDAAAQIMKLGDAAAQSLGLSKTAVNEAAVAFSAFGEKIAAGGSVGDVFEDYITRATDFASVMNLDVNDALTKFQSALGGQSDVLDKFGIDVGAASVKAFALANGIATAGQEMTEAEKVQARYGLLMEQTAKFAGDFANTSEGLANQQRTLNAEWENAQIQIGEGLVPVMNKLVGVAIDLIPAFILIAEAAAEVAVSVFDVAKPILDLLSLMGKAGEAADRAAEGNEEYAAAMDKAKQKSKDMAMLQIPLLVRGYNSLLEAITPVAKGMVKGLVDVDKATTEMVTNGRQLFPTYTESVETWRRRIQDNTRDAARAFQTWSVNVRDAQAEAAQGLSESMATIVDLFAKAPDKIKTSVEKMIANIRAQKQMAVEFEASMRILMAAGLDAVVDELEKAGPAAVDAAALLANDLESALALEIDLNTILGTEADLLTADFALRQRFNTLGITLAQALKDGFGTPSLATPTVAAPTVPKGVAPRDVSGVFGFATGGVVPGPIGAAVPAIVHGGETITPPGGSGQQVTIGEMNVTLQGTFDQSDPSSARRFAVQMREQLDALNAEVA